MELLKLDERPATFDWKGIKIFFRTKVSTGDKYELDTSGVIVENDQITYTRWGYYKTLIKLFVTGWEGVTVDGKPAPYSYEALTTQLPSEKNEDLIMSLGLEIAKKTGLYSSPEKKEEGDSIKND